MSLQLWEEQLNVCQSQNLQWHSLQLDQHIYYTPNAFNIPMMSTVEGIREIPGNEHSAGWFIYTSVDRENGEGFLHTTLGDALRQYNLSILRFLGLPPGWMFNIDMSGNSHVWLETQESTEPNG